MMETLKQMCLHFELRLRSPISGQKILDRARILLERVCETLRLDIQRTAFFDPKIRVL